MTDEEQKAKKKAYNAAYYKKYAKRIRASRKLYHKMNADKINALRKERYHQRKLNETTGTN